MAIQETKRGIFVPTFHSQANVFKADIVGGIFGNEPLSTPHINGNDLSAVNISLVDFAANLRQSEVNSLMKKRLKGEDCNMSDRNFSISPFYPAYNLGMEHGYFFADGNTGIILEAKSEFEDGLSLGLAMASFDFPKKAGGNPVIVQLQTFSPREAVGDDFIHLKAEATSVLKQFRWEKALIDIVMIWARGENFPFLYVQPGSENYYVKLHSLENRARIRYDMTAERMGFEKMSNGLWGYKL